MFGIEFGKKREASGKMTSAEAERLAVEEKLKKQFPDIPWGQVMTLRELVQWGKDYNEKRGHASSGEHMNFDDGQKAMDKKVFFAPRMVEGSPVIGIRTEDGEEYGMISDLLN